MFINVDISIILSILSDAIMACFLVQIWAKNDNFDLLFNQWFGVNGVEGVCSVFLNRL